MMKVKKMPQSSAPHFVIPMIDGVLREPRKRFTARETIVMKMAMKCLRHYLKWDFSASSI